MAVSSRPKGWRASVLGMRQRYRRRCPDITVSYRRAEARQRGSAPLWSTSRQPNRRRAMRRSWCAAVLAALVLLAGCTGTAENSGGRQGMAAAGRAQTEAGAGVEASPRSESAVPAPRSLAKTATLTVRVTDVDAQADRAIGIAIAAGGDVLADQRSGSSGRASAELTLEVPPATLEPQLGRLGRLGEQVNRASSTDDV